MISKNEYGSIVLTEEAIKDIAKIAIDKFSEFTPAKKENSFVSIMNKNDEVIVNVKVKIKQGTDVVKACKKLQSEVHNAIEDMSGIDVKSINIDIEGFTY